MTAHTIPDTMIECPFCGETGDIPGEPPGLLEVFHDDAAGDQWIQWAACCMEAQDQIGQLNSYGDDGHFETYGVRLEAWISALLGLDVRELYTDGSGVMRCRLAVKAPGQGVKGWRGYVFDRVTANHRHHKAPQGWKFGVSVSNGLTEVGVAVVGRPVSRMLAQAEPGTLEVTRVCTWGEPRLRRNASSKLYAACAAEARKLGATKLITYTLEEENGASLKASGFTAVAQTSGGSWNRPGRARTDQAPICRKTRWERVIA